MKTGNTIIKIADLPDGETYCALIDDTISSHDGYDARDGGGWSQIPYIRIVYLGNKEQAIGWMHQQEQRRDSGLSAVRYRIVMMKDCPVQRTILFDL